MNVIGYIRVSRVGGRSGDSFISPKEQRKAIEALAQREGFTVVDWYEEFDASGGDSARPLWNEALARIDAGKVQGLAVWNFSRFSRSTIDALNALERIEAAGGTLYSASGDVGDDTPTGKLTRTIFAGLAQMERERAREGFKTAQRAAIERGIFTASRVPTGYTRNPETRKLEPNEMAPVIREMFEMRAKGSSWVELVNYMTAHGGSDRTTAQTVSNMLRNPSYLGWSRHGSLVNKNAHQPLVSQRLFDSVAAKEVPRKHTGRAAAESLLGGLVVCDNCGYRMFVTSSGKGTLTYTCKHIQCKLRASARVADVDSEVLSRIFGFMAGLVTEGQGRLARRQERSWSDDLVEAQKAVADAEYMLAKFEAGRREYLRVLSPAEFASELASLRADLEVAKIAQEQAESTRTAPSAFADFRASWDEWTHESRREWLPSFVDRVVITSARRRPIPAGERMALYLRGEGDDVVLESDGTSRFV